jgi:hypothetical protein
VDLAAPVLPEEFKLTAEMLADLDEYGQVGKVLGILAKQNEILMAGSKANGVSAAAAAQAAAPAAATEDPQAIVSADPDLSRWQRSELAWSEVQKADQYLKDRPEFAGKPLSARLEKINEMVRARLGEAPKAPAKAPAAAPARQVKQQIPNSLSDIGGAAVNQDASFAERTADKSEQDIYAEMERQLAAGVSIDDMLT